MNKYYLESIIQKAEEARTITEYETIDEAERAYHHVLAQNIDGQDVDFARCKIINTHGGNIMAEYWQAEAADPESDSTKYYFTQIRFKTDGTTLRSISVYDTLDEAVVAFHNLLYAGMADQQYSALMTLIEDKYGAELKRRYWVRS